MPALPVLTLPSATTLLRELANSIEGEIRTDAHDRLLYATDASLYQVEPLGVIIPASIEDAGRAVAFCREKGLPLLPRGGGTSLAGQCTNRAVVIDFSVHCRAILELGPGFVRVEPGITVDDLNDAIAASGTFFAPDPATSRHANIGGCIGNNAAGARSIKYGRTSENVLGVDLLLAGAPGEALRLEKGAAAGDPRVGELTRRVCAVVAGCAPLIRERFPKTVRRNAGYGLDMVLTAMESAGWREGPVTHEAMAAVNLAHLICGSEGTLAVTVGAQLRLHPRPAAKGLAVLGFSDLDEAIAQVIPILATGPSAVELLDDTVIDLARENIEYRRYVDLMPAPAAGPLKAVLYVEYFAESAAAVRERFDLLARTTPGIAAQFHTDAGAMLNAWKLRKAGEPLLHGVPGHRKPITFIEDNAIPVENLGRFVKELRDIVTAHGTRAAFWAHASVGVLHVRPLLDIHDAGDRARMIAIALETADLARSLGGVMSGEHGDGRARGPLLERFFGPELMGAFREIKNIFDPRGLLNPGNIVEPRAIETIAETLRIAPLGRPVPVPADIGTYFDYTDAHGFDGAVEMCNGAGVCRKKQGGTMCPSYMATLDERHSTRGRGNALRLAITGQGGAAEGGASSPGAEGPQWSDAGTMQTLDLCLSCKACKTECPSNVDIARLKSEFTAQRHKADGRAPLATRLFGSIRLLNRMGSLTPGLANFANRTPLVRAVANRLMGLHPKRSLPLFARALTRDWPPTTPITPITPAATDAPTVALFGDCFTMFNEPGIGLATRRVLEAFGYRVILADAGCCGRAKISLGLLPGAIEEADGTLTRLRPLIEDGSVQAILFAEPSCLSAVKDDWLSLKLRTPVDVRKRLAAKSFLPEDFLNQRWETHPVRPAFRNTGPVVLHAHCHQKALWGAESSGAMLRRAFGADLKVLDTGCCGMAGSFGYTKDRYDLSMKIGELTLFPAVRGAGAAIAAPGASCRHQIHDGVAREARHPMELLAAALETGGEEVRDR